MKKVKSIISVILAVCLLVPLALFANAAYSPANKVTVNNGRGGGFFTEGDTVRIIAPAPADGMVFTGWSSDSAAVTFDSQSSAQTSFIMPREALSVTADFTEEDVSAYYTQITALEPTEYTPVERTPDAPTANGFILPGDAVNTGTSQQYFAFVDADLNDITAVLGDAVLSQYRCTDGGIDVPLYSSFECGGNVIYTTDRREFPLEGGAVCVLFVVNADGTLSASDGTFILNCTCALEPGENGLNINELGSAIMYGTQPTVRYGIVSADAYNNGAFGAARTYTFYNPVAEGRHFDGWKYHSGDEWLDGPSDNGDGTSSFDFSYSPDDVTMIPCFVPGNTLRLVAGEGATIQGLDEKLIETSDTHDVGAYIPIKAGYCFDGWYTDPACEGERVSVIDSFENRVCTLYAKWTDGTQLDVPFPYTDIPKAGWYTDAALWCRANVYMSGTADTLFSPNLPLTRAMFVLIIAKIDGANLTPYENTTSFGDVPADRWYSAAVEWAYRTGVTSGIGNGRFGPDGRVTREQLAVFLRANAHAKGADTTVRTDMTVYTDAPTISGWASEAFSWAIAEEIMSGTTSKTLSPKITATRAQVALTAMKFCTNVLSA